MATSILTNSLLNSIRATPHLPPASYYLLTATALSTLNLPHLIPDVYKHALEHGNSPPSRTNGQALVKPSEQLSITRRIRESLVKSSAIIGLPKTINALFALKAVTPAHLIDAPLSPSVSGRSVDLYTTPSSVIMQRGAKFFEQVYGKVTNRVMGQMDRSGTEDLGLLARLEYGYVLSPVGLLSAAETSYGECTCLFFLFPFVTTVLILRPLLFVFERILSSQC